MLELAVFGWMTLSMGVLFCMLKAALGAVFDIKGPGEPGYFDFFGVGCMTGAFLGGCGLVLEACARWLFG